MKIALIGNPNTGKSTFFNSWTGMHQTCGNWPGVTVEQLLGETKVGTLVDLPGIYSLHAVSEDERVAANFALSQEYDVIVNVVDAVNLERNLYLTLALSELRKPMVVVLTMTDILHKQGVAVKWAELSKRLGVPVLKSSDIQGIETAVAHAATSIQNRIEVQYPSSIELAISKAHREGEPYEAAILRLEGITDGAEEQIENFEKAEGTTPDVLIADARYATIYKLIDGIIRHTKKTTRNASIIADQIVLNRWLGVPIFLGIMYLLFWVTQVVGGCFIDFFDHLGGALFVTGPTSILESLNAPNWLIMLLANGLGVGLQTVATFIPPVFFIFLGLSILEDSGYMARAAYVMDRLMRFLGLPGSAFVPMLVGFGCTVPAIMATRTLSTKRDRFLTIFMTPFMSCGARLPVYALFGAAFFGKNAGMMVFAVYLVGLVLAVVTGLLMKHTLFVGAPSMFVMELPLYHFPRPAAIFKTTWTRLQGFLLRAGKIITIMVLLLNLCNEIKINSEGRTLLEGAGQIMTPIFEPMGIAKDNWQASVALVTGLFAKEAVVGTLNSLYASDEEESTTETTSFLDEIKEGFASIGESVSGLLDTITDPMGVGIVEGDEETVLENVESNVTTLRALRTKFIGPNQAFAYLLFILLYVPCLAAMATILREIGWRYGVILGSYLTLLGWSVATLYYQISTGHQFVWITTATSLCVAMAITLFIIGRNFKISTNQ